MNKRIMKQTAITLVVLFLFYSAPAQAQDSGALVIITRAATLTSRVAPAENFTGMARVQVLFDTTAMTRAYGVSVSFEAGARTAWHAHPRGQVLIVTGGVGRVQRWGAPIDEIRQGDVVRIPPNVKHWHGAAPTTAMTHISIIEHYDGTGANWMEKVSDAQYDKPVRVPETPPNELVEAITHLAFYAGWPNAITAVTVAREVFAGAPR